MFNKKYAPWAWTPCEKEDTSFQIPLGNTDPNKLITVISWDAGYREEKWLDLSFQCLKKQTIRDQVNFIHIEWSDKPNPILSKFPFINIVCMGFENNTSIWPSYDVGLQWNLGLYLAQTSLVTYFHNDIIHRNQLRDIIDKAERNEEVIIFTGYEINYKGKHSIEHQKEFPKLVREASDDFDLLAYKYNGKFKRNPHLNANLATFKKEPFINTLNGFFWNLNMERWDGLGYKDGRLYFKNHIGTSDFKYGMHAQKDMSVFTIPHGGQGTRQVLEEKRKILTIYDSSGDIKYYSDFIKDWLPRHGRKIHTYR